MRTPTLFVGLFSMLALASASLGAAQRTLWQIGKFDQSSYEFQGHFNLGDPSVHPTFTVGESDPAKDWPAVQPGTAVGWLGARPHPYAILFTLREPPRGTYRLVVSVILTHSRVPNLQVEINGRTGIFYFHRKPSYYPGDGGVDSPIYGSAEIQAILPASALRKGKNKLVLTAVDDPKLGEGDSWINYDALRLDQNRGAKPAAAPQISVYPTVFYVHDAGGLAELTEVTVTHVQPLHAGEVTLEIAGRRLMAMLSGGHDFGEERVPLLVPELHAPTEAQVIVRLDGRSTRSRITLTPARRWTLDVVPHAHLDVGFTDYHAKVAEIHNRNLDKLLDEIAAHPEMRFSLDGSWIVRNYLASRDPQAVSRLFALVKQGKIAVPAQLANLMTGYPTLEELIRTTDYTRWLHEKYGVPFDYSNITDVPSYTWSEASVLAALGIKYFSAAANSDRGPILLYGRWNQKSPFWWEGPDGSKVLMSYSRQYFQLSFVCGVPATEANCVQSLPTFLAQYDSPSYKPDVVLMYGSQIENTDLIPGEPEFAAEWNSKFAYPKMVLTTFPDYMRTIDRRYGPELATVRGDGGPYWEDGYGTDVHYLTMDRETQQRAPSAEKLSTIATYLHKNVSGPAAEIRAMWNDLVLYAEHTFTSWGGYSRPESEETVRQFFNKDQFAVDGRQRANAILEQAFSQLADQIHVQANAVVVFNSLNWTRSGLVEMDLDHGDFLRAYPDQQPVPYETLAHHADYDHIRFMARNVPSLGYRCYQVVNSGERPPAGEVAQPLSNAIENAYYRITVDPAAGAVQSIYDKQLGRELVGASSPYRFNQYLYVSGGDGATQIVFLRKSLPLAQLTIGASSGGRVTSVRRTSYGQILTYETSGPHAPRITTDVILFDHEKKIEFVNRVHKDPVDGKEAVYFAFPVAAAHPEFSYEIQNAWVDPARDMLQGANVAWFTVQHWVKVSGGGVSVGLTPIDSPLLTLGDIVRGTWPEKFDPKSATIFSYALNNYWHTNFRRVQSGDFMFRYALTSGAELAPAELARFGRAAMTPLEMGELIGNDKYDNPARPLSTNPTSFLQVDAPDVVVENWKMADDGNGTIVRLLETGGETAHARLTFPVFKVERAWLDNAAEVNQHPLRVSGHSIELDLTPHEIATIRIVAPKIAGGDMQSPAQ